MNLNIVIIGAGDVGFNLAKSLSKEDHAITVIDVDSQKCSRVKNLIDAKVIEGDGTSQRLLAEIKMEDVDYVLDFSSSIFRTLVHESTLTFCSHRNIIESSLAYFCWPNDLILDTLGPIGFTDDTFLLCFVFLCYVFLKKVIVFVFCFPYESRCQAQESFKIIPAKP